MCDRILCPLKASIRKYCNEGHDVGSAKGIERETGQGNDGVSVYSLGIELSSRN